MVKGRNDRQEAVKSIVRETPVRTQRDLVLALRERGYSCTQATISRDIADMGLRKLPEGMYVLAEDLHLQRMVSEFVSDAEAVTSLVVVKTQPGTAPGVAAAIDAAELPGVLGSIAGNDTVLVICRTNEGAQATSALLGKLMRMHQEEL